MTRPAVLPRRGAVMFVALAALATVAAIAAAMLSGALAGRRQLRAERDSLQVEQLLDLATREARERGAAGHGADGMRVVPTDAIVGSGSARITTTVAPGGDGAVRVVVEYPLEGPVTIRRTREVTVPVPARSPSHEEQSP